MGIAPRVEVELVLEDLVEWGDGGAGAENADRGWEIEGLDLEVGGGGSEEGEGVGGGVEVEVGAEDRVGILEVVEGVLEKGDVWGFSEEES